jgi:hypothetical protein
VLNEVKTGKVRKNKTCNTLIAGFTLFRLTQPNILAVREEYPLLYNILVFNNLKTTQIPDEPLSEPIFYKHR